MSQIYKKIKKILKYSINIVIACLGIIFDFAKKHKYISAIAVIVIVVGFSVYNKNHPTQNSSDIKNVPQVIQKISTLMALPTDETPTLFEVADPKFLATKEPFFIGATKGDILVIYQKAGKAIIYSPSRNIIVNAGPLVNSK